MEEDCSVEYPSLDAFVNYLSIDTCNDSGVDHQNKYHLSNHIARHKHCLVPFLYNNRGLRLFCSGELKIFDNFRPTPNKWFDYQENIWKTVFNPNCDDIAEGVWNGLGLANNFFLGLLHLCRSDKTPHTTSKVGSTLPCFAKDAAKLDIALAVKRVDTSTSLTLTLTQVSTEDSNYSRTFST